MNIFSKDLVKEWGIENLSPAEQEDAVLKLGLTLYQAILVRSLDILSGKDQDELDTILDNDETTPEAVVAFLEKKIPTFQELLVEEKNNLKRDILLIA